MLVGENPKKKNSRPAAALVRTGRIIRACACCMQQRISCWSGTLASSLVRTYGAAIGRSVHACTYIRGSLLVSKPAAVRTRRRTTYG